MWSPPLVIAWQIRSYNWSSRCLSLCVMHAMAINDLNRRKVMAHPEVLTFRRSCSMAWYDSETVMCTRGAHRNHKPTHTESKITIPSQHNWVNIILHKWNIRANSITIIIFTVNNGPTSVFLPHIMGSCVVFIARRQVLQWLQNSIDRK